jgi:AAA+ ATPase superfamily predicted ATPase
MADSAFPSIMQRIWDLYMEKSNIMLILCGSLITMMEAQTMYYSAPLYGRRTGQIKLKQIPFRFYQEFFPEKNRKELVEYYAVTGGVPRYIEIFRDSPDIFSGIASHIIAEDSFLHEEPINLLQREVSVIGSYLTLLTVIAQGSHKLSAIAAQMETKQTSLSPYLKTLCDLDIVEREVPVTEKNPQTSKMGLYHIKDNFICFWFKFIFPALSDIGGLETDEAMKKIRENFIDNHAAFVYEDVCRQMLIENKQLLKNKWDFNLQRAGRWWNKNQEIDIIGLDADNNSVVMCECKFHKQPIGLGILYELIEKSKQVQWGGPERKTYYILFSINGFDKNLRDEAAGRGDVLLWE